jgi:hypothetical protein
MADIEPDLIGLLLHQGERNATWPRDRFLFFTELIAANVYPLEWIGNQKELSVWVPKKSAPTQALE